jgi:hypothetical protein
MLKDAIAYRKRRTWRNTMKKFLLGTVGLVVLGKPYRRPARPYTKAPPVVAPIYN